MSARVVSCRARASYELELRFEDGLQGEVYLGNLVDIGAFSRWRDLALFMTARPDNDSGTIVWPAAGVRLDADILYADIAARGGRPAPAPGADRFMQRALEAPRRRQS
jgi:hypothetical protein